MHRFPSLAMLALATALSCSPATAQTSDGALAARIDRLLGAHPVIDGHNDLPEQLRERYGLGLDNIDLRADTARLPRLDHMPADTVPLMTDLTRMKTGRVGGQFWSVWIDATMTGPAAVVMTMEQIDLVKRMVQRYPDRLAMAYSADDIERQFKAGRVASLIGIEGGHQVDHSLAMLRQMHDLGARYMTLTHSRNTPWADSATDNPQHHGLTPFGKAMVHEMNRVGMMVDLSHVSAETARDALAVSQAPVLFSHSGARVVADHPRNLSDDTLRMVASNRGVVMVNFYAAYVSVEMARWLADQAAEAARFNAPPFAGLYIGQPERARAAMEKWQAQHPMPPVTLAMVADHVEHIRKVCGVDCVGIGSDFDGIDLVPAGLDGVDKYPALFVELARRGWRDEDLAKLANGNVLRVMRGAEATARRLQASEQASVQTLPPPVAASAAPH
ncbi:dipeptidase [Massilia sp. DWR3-1-1]|uniref:dipeptidase n=1 Tax=Massilia sp. DWR3-1-1 TaxID=2804559 RepID=UPI003CEAE9D5